MDRDTKLIAILRRQYHIILTASWEKIYSVLGGVAKRIHFLLVGRKYIPYWAESRSEYIFSLLGENIFRIRRSREATEPNTEYIFSQRRQYNVVLPSQNRN